MSKNIAENSGERLDYLDAAKGICTLLVILFHINGYTAFSKWYTFFIIPVFFFVTGILSNRRKSWKNQTTGFYIKKNAKSLLYPYLTVSLVTLAILTLKSFTPFYNLSRVFNEILNMLTLNGIDALWFLPRLFFVKILFYFIMRKSESIKKVISALVITMAVSCAVSAYLILANPLEGATGLVYWAVLYICMLGGVAIGLFFVFVGYYFDRLVSISFLLKHRVASSLASIAVLIVSVFVCQFNTVEVVSINMCRFGNPLIFFPMSILCCIAITVVCACLLSKIRLLNYIGRNSLIIFSTHLNWQLVFAAEMVSDKANALTNGMIYANQYIGDIFQLVIVVAAELALVWLVNKFLPILFRLPSKK